MRSKHASLSAATVLFILLVDSGAAANPLVEGSVDAGQARATTCAACHGPEGKSVNPQWPSLAGQHAPYIVKQLQAYKDGTRTDPLMTAQAQALSEEDMRNLAVYYAAQRPAPKVVANPATVEKGAALYRGGDPENEVAACSACHGPAGQGNPAAAYPLLKGQHATYTAAQLRAYASGARKSDGTTRIMREIAARMREDEIVAIASYVQGLR